MGRKSITNSETTFNTLVDANIIDKLNALNDNHLAPAQSVDARIAAISAEIADAKDTFTDDVGNSKMINDQLVAQIIQVNQEAEALQQHLTTTIAELRDEKETNKKLQASVQSQLAAVHALASNSSGGTGGGGARKSNEPIVCHKLMLNKVARSGEEDHDSFDVRFIDMTRRF